MSPCIEVSAPLISILKCNCMNFASMLFKTVARVCRQRREAFN